MEQSKPDNTQNPTDKTYPKPHNNFPQNKYNNSVRIFPQIQPDIYTKRYHISALTPEQKVACKLLALANKKFTKWERLIGWKLDAQGKIGRLLFQHQLAIEAELEGQWKQADFYWSQVQIEIKTLAKQKYIWLTLALEIAAEPGVQVMKDPVKMRQRLVDELLIDTHITFYNELVQQVKKLALYNRAFAHIDYIMELLNLSNLSGNPLLALLGEAWKKQIILYQKEGRWNEAIRVCTNRLKYFPESINFQEKLAEVYVLEILEKLSNEKSKQLQDAKKLISGIDHLEKLLKKYPHSLAIFQGIGRLYYASAIKLTNGGKRSEGLLHLQKALTYHPDLDQKVYEIRHQLIEAMRISKSYEQNFQEPIAGRTNRTFDSDEEQILNEANIAFILTKDYINSPEAKATAEAFKKAVKRLQDENQLSRVIIPASSHNRPILNPKSNQDKQKAEPFFPWVFSRQDLNLKLQATFASILVLIAGNLAIREPLVSSARNSAYEQITAEAKKDNYQGIVEEAEKFFANDPMGRDNREREVKQLYDLAFMNWFLEQEDQLDDDALIHIKRYKAFSKNRK